MPSGVELATAYISITAETAGIKRQVTQALNGVQSDATKAGKGIGRNLFAGAGAEADRAGRDTGARFSNAVKGALTAAGLTAVAATAVAGIKQVFDAGLGFERNANTFQAVTRASTAEMEAMRAKARDLGNDITLTGASASDALSAMTELAKGGLTVSQTMDAARGSLQLASAAQVDSAEAAAIQARTLAAFNLDGTKAGHVADLLANGANSATGEITDMAYALQSGSAVAASMGISVDDTVTALSLLAKNSIIGSDAGTLLKSALLALQSPSDAAAGALDDLGVKAWDAQGNFVGLPVIFQQLQDAQHRLTPEMYAWATSTAFGSDAARLAGIAGKEGATGFAAMGQSVTHFGGAAEVAAAQTQGLPGVMERLSNTAEAAKLQLFDFVDGPAQDFGNWLNTIANQGLGALDDLASGKTPEWLQGLTSAGAQALPALKSLGSTAADVLKTLGSGAGDAAVETLTAIGAVASTVVVPALNAVSSLLDGSGTAVAAVATAFVGWRFITPMLTAVNAKLAAGAAGVTALTAAQARNLAVSRTAGVALGTFGTHIANIGDRLPAVARMQHAFLNGAIGAERFGRTVGTAQAALSGFRSAGSGVLSLFGGGWGAAFTAATLGVVFWSESVNKAKQRADALADSTNRIAISQRDMLQALLATGGDVDDTVIAKVAEQIDAFNEQVDSQSRGPGIADWATATATALGGLGKVFSGDWGGAKQAFDDAMNPIELRDSAAGFDAVGAAMQALNMSSTDVARKLASDGPTWDEFRQQLVGTGEGGQRAAEGLDGMRENLLRAQTAAKTVTPGMIELRTAISVLASESSSAADKANALRTALDVLAGKPISAAKATADYNKTLLDQKDAMAGLQGATLDSAGAIDTNTDAGQNLFRMLQDLYDATTNIVSGDPSKLGEVFGRNAEQLGAMERAAGVVPGSLSKILEQWGLVQSRVSDLTVDLKGAPETIQEVTTIVEKLQSIPPNTPVVVQKPNGDVAAALEAIGVKITTINDSFVSIEVDPQTVPKLDGIGAKIDQIARSRTVRFDPVWTMNPAQAPPGASASPPATSGQVIAPWLAPKATGGPISGGTPGKDSVPILGMPGEHMLDVQDVKNLGGHAGVYALRAAAANGWTPMKTGGPVPGGGAIDPTKVREAQDAVADNRNALAVAQAELQELPADATPTARLSAQQAAAKAQRELEQSIADAEAIAAGAEPPSHSGGNQVADADASVAMSRAKLDELKASGKADPSALLAAEYEVSASQRDADQARVDYANTPTRTEGYIPAGAGNTSVAGTSFVSGLLDMGAEAVNGAIDMAASAGGGAANMFAPGAGIGVQIGADIAKQGVSYGFNMAGIGVDALIEQITPFGAPRWLSTDPTAFIPQLPNQKAGTTTAEKAVNAANGGSAVDPNTTVHGTGATPPVAQPGDPVQPGQLPGSGAPGQPVAPPPPGVGTGPLPGPAPGAPLASGAPLDPQSPDWMKRLGIPIPGLFDEGGVLPPGGTGVNQTTKPEMVLTGKQWDTVMSGRIPDTGPQDPDPLMAGGALFSVGQIVAQDSDDAIRKWRNEANLASMRYRGRP